LKNIIPKVITMIHIHHQNLATFLLLCCHEFQKNIHPWFVTVC
jgi:hypothetical protein